MNPMKKTILCLLMAAVLVLQGCAAGQTIPNQTTAPTTAQTSASTGETAESTSASPAAPTAPPTTSETTDTEPTATETTAESTTPLPTEPVTWLTCAEPGDLPAVLSAADGTLLFNWMDGDSTCFLSVDPFADRVLAERTVEERWTLYDSLFEDGSCAIYNWDREQWCFLDRSLADDGTFAGPWDGRFSDNREVFYCVEDLRLLAVSVADGSKRDITPAGLRVTDVMYSDRAGRELAVWCQASLFGGEICAAVIDLTDGTCRMLQREAYAPYDVGDAVLLMNYGECGFDVRAETGDGQFRYYPSGLFEQGERDLSVVTGLPMLLSSGIGSTLWDLRGGLGVCELESYGIGEMVRTARRVGDTSFVVGGVFREGVPAMFLLNTAALEFAPADGFTEIPSPYIVDEALLAEATQLPDQIPVPEYLRTARELADRIGETYGIHIVISDQCLALEPVTWDGLETTAALIGNTLTESEEADQILLVLEQLEEVLQLYPEGFFRQMCNAHGDGGVILGLTSLIRHDFSVSGMTYNRELWQVILVDITGWTQSSVFAHELWHATENTIRSRVTGAFDDTEWMACNPEGFAYHESPLADVDDPARWTLFHEDDANVYFVDTYARTNAMEDRARIMETIMTMDVTSQYLLRSPAMRKKLEIMCSAVRAGFDFTGWTDVKWERWMAK